MEELYRVTAEMLKTAIIEKGLMTDEILNRFGDWEDAFAKNDWSTCIVILTEITDKATGSEE